MTDNSPRPLRPDPSEYNEYYGIYIDRVPEGDVVEILKRQKSECLDFLSQIREEKRDHRYAPGKWSVREVVGHIIDTEWVFTYRALLFARGDATPLPGIDQNVLMSGANFGQRSWESLVQEFNHLRSANTCLFESFDQSVLDRTGVASGFEFTVRALLYIIAGHELHHRAGLKKKYLGL